MTAPSKRPRGSIKSSVCVRLTAGEVLSLRAMADAHGLSAAAYLRRHIPRPPPTLGGEQPQTPTVKPQLPPRVVPAAIDAATLACVRQAAGLLWSRIKGGPLQRDAECQQALSAMIAAAKAIQARCADPKPPRQAVAHAT